MGIIGSNGFLAKQTIILVFYIIFKYNISNILDMTLKEKRQGGWHSFISLNNKFTSCGFNDAGKNTFIININVYSQIYIFFLLIVYCHDNKEIKIKINRKK